MTKKKQVRSSVYVSVEVDPIDVIDELSDDECEIIAKSWGYVPENEGGKAAAIDAINQIRAGKTDDAIVTLERAFLPTWEDTAACEARYREVMGRVA
jgi:hypothetical protein